MVLKKRPLSGNTYKLPLYFIVISEDFILQMDVHLVWPHSKCEANIIRVLPLKEKMIHSQTKRIKL